MDVLSPGAGPDDLVGVLSLGDHRVRECVTHVLYACTCLLRRHSDTWKIALDFAEYLGGPQQSVRVGLGKPQQQVGEFDGDEHAGVEESRKGPPG